MKLIVGLGNPGSEYNNTRHNAGFMIIDNFAKYYNVEISKTKFNGNYCEVFINNEKVILLKPLSYMNLSGEVVKKFIDYYDISINDILVICDDMDHQIGDYKLKQNGSSGGHNGLKNIELHIGTQNYKRLKIGISKCEKINVVDYVLGKFSNEEKELITKNYDLYNSILNDYISIPFSDLMSKYNRKRQENDI